MNPVDCDSQEAARCAEDPRRDRVAASGILGGVDYVEVYPDGVTLCVHLFGRIPASLSQRNVVVEGGDRIRNLRVLHAEFEEHDDGDSCLRVVVDRTGDFSVYCLCLIAPIEQHTRCSFDSLPPPSLVRAVPHGIDPRYACASFGFRLDCPSELDCKPVPCASALQLPAPAIDYLARDFTGFRQLLLDRLALTVPDWHERHLPDLGITVVELLAYLADRLSYQLDAIATEAYLGTARKRISVRRHARLVDYRMHEGCNARALVTIDASVDVASLPVSQIVFAAPAAEGEAVVRGLVRWRDLEAMPTATIFEPIDCSHAGMVHLYKAHSTIHFYTWGGVQCCLPAGSRRATLRDSADAGNHPGPIDMPGRKQQPDANHKVDPEDKPDTRHKPDRILHLKRGDLLIFEEIRGAVTGMAVDADPAKRHAVRLLRVEKTIDPLDGTPLLEVEWGRADALPFALCLSARTAPRAPEAVSVRLGTQVTVQLLPDTAPGVPAPVLSIDTPPGHGEAEITSRRFVTYTPVAEFAGFDTVELRVTDADGGRRTRALTFNVGGGTECAEVEVAVARGNVLLVDHGRSTWESNDDWVVRTESRAGCCQCDGAIVDVTTSAGRIAIALAQPPVTHSACACEPDAPAHSLCVQDPRTSAAQVWLDMAPADPLGATVEAFPGSFDWLAVQDLLGSASNDRHFVAEIDDEGHPRLRFGDGDCGRAPPAGSRFRARYRVGNGSAGNVGADAISIISLRSGFRDGVTLRPRNPLAARGGIDAEPIEHVKQYAPHAYGRTLERAVTAADYAIIAGRDPRIEGVKGELAWTGGWYEADVALDVYARDEGDDSVAGGAIRRLQQARRLGHDVRVVPVRRVPLSVTLDLCVDGGYARASVARAVLDVLSNRVLADGSLGWFHPDRLVFGEDIAGSQIVAAVQRLDGIAHVELVTLCRADDVPAQALQRLAAGVIEIGADEIAQLDNDPDFPERGTLTLKVRGGR